MNDTNVPQIVIKQEGLPFPLVLRRWLGQQGCGCLWCDWDAKAQRARLDPYLLAGLSQVAGKNITLSHLHPPGVLCLLRPLTWFRPESRPVSSSLTTRHGFDRYAFDGGPLTGLPWKNFNLMMAVAHRLACVRCAWGRSNSPSRL